MILTIIIILGILAFVLGLLEVYLLPGVGVAGIGAALCALADVVLIGSEYGTSAAVVALFAAIAVLMLMLRAVSRSRTLERLSLDSTIDSTAARAEQLSVKPGDEGRTLTRLALIGNAVIAGKVVEVKSDGAFIPEDTPVVVTSVNEALILVRAKRDDEVREGQADNR